MPTPSRPSRAQDLIILAGRMGIPVDEAVRQVTEVIAGVQSPVVVPVEPCAVAVPAESRDVAVPAEPRDVAVPAESRDVAVPAEPREAESVAVV